MQEDKARKLFDALVAIPAPSTPEHDTSKRFRPMFDVQLSAGTQAGTSFHNVNAGRIWAVSIKASANPRGTNWRKVMHAIEAIDSEMNGLTQIAVANDGFVLT